MSRKPNFFQKKIRKLEILIEKIRGLDFSEVIPSKELGYNKSIVIQCSPSGGRHLYRLLKDLNITNRDKILDIGCGKGSAIKTMLKFNFSKIIGIEISKYLCCVAKKNFLNVETKRLKIININAEKYLGYGKVNYYYLYNPFPKSVMKKVIANILSQNFTNTKILNIIYNNPKCSLVLKRNGFEEVKTYDDQWGNGIKLFRKKF
jgi:SAM-dependent methyltransferase